MSDITVKKLSETAGISLERLLEQLDQSGIKKSGPDATVNAEERELLLGFLRKSHGKEKEAASNAAPKKITLNRKSVSELRQPRSTRGKARSVSVEVRKKRTYVKRTVAPGVEEQVLPAGQVAKTTEVAIDRVEKPRVNEADVSAAKPDTQKPSSAVAPEVIAPLVEKPKTQEVPAAPKAKAPARPTNSAPGKPPAAAPKARVGRSADKAPAKARSPKADPDRKRFKVERKEAPKSAKGEGFERKPGKRAPKRGTAGKGNEFGRPARVRPKKRGGQKGAAKDEKFGFEMPTERATLTVSIPPTIVVGELAKKLSVKSTEVIKALMSMGVMATINQAVDQDTAVLVVEELGHEAVMRSDDDVERELVGELAADYGEVSGRPPVVTIMGHVDHGKTSLLDHIRATRVAPSEAGGITQHIGAYHVDLEGGVITFLDTPGHAAFTAMRARGAEVTDLVIIVVAADDGVKPQTIEAVEHAKAAKVPLIVAVNKIDKPGADLDRVKQELATLDVVPEDWGGDTMFIPVSAKTGEGVTELLEAILLQSEFLELTAPTDGPGAGVVVEASLEKGRGAVATVLVQKGTLKKGDFILAGEHFGRVRALFDENKKSVPDAGPSIPVVVLGLPGAPQPGDELVVASSEKKAREIAEIRKNKIRENRLNRVEATTLDNVFTRLESAKAVDLNLIVKADVQGSLQAIRQSLMKMTHEEVRINIVSSAVGGINDSDANLAAASGAIVIGFNVRADVTSRAIIDEKNIELRYFSVIYDLIDSVRASVNGMLAPEIKEVFVGLAEVRDVFRSPKMGAVAGCIVQEGCVRKDNPIRVLRNNIVIYDGVLESLRRFKDSVSEVISGTECGIAVKNYDDVQPGDQIEVYELIEVARTID